MRYNRSIGSLPRRQHLMPTLDERAQTVLDALFEMLRDIDNPRTTVDYDGSMYYLGSLHILCREVSPGVNPDTIVKRLEQAGCISSAERGKWEIHHNNVYDGQVEGDKLDPVPATTRRRRLPVETPLSRRMATLEGRFDAVSRRM